MRKLEISVFILLLLTMNITKVFIIGNVGKFNIAMSDILVPIVFFLLIVRIKKDSLKSIFKEFGIFLILVLWLIIVGTISILDNKIIDSGYIGMLEELTKTIICILYFWIGYNTLKIIPFESFKWTWVLSVILFIFGGIFLFLAAVNDVFYWSADSNYRYMFMGTDTDPNHAATYLTISFFAMGIFTILSSKKNSKLITSTCLALSAFGVVMTASRGGMLGLVAGILVVLVFYAFKNFKLALTLFFTLIIVILVFLQIDLYLLDSFFSERLVYKLSDFGTGFETRYNLGKVALLMGNDHPIFGVGRGNYILNSRQYFEMIGSEFIDNIPHNTYLGLYAETGIFGLLMFFSPVLFIAYSTFQKRHVLMNKDKSLVIWLFAGIVALSIQAFVLNIENRRFLWYLAGILLFIVENDYFNIDKMHNHKFKYLDRINTSIILIIISTALIVLSAFTVNIKHRPVIIEDIFEYELPYTKISKAENYEVWTNLTIKGDANFSDKVRLEIIEILRNGSENILFNEEYSGLVGNIKVKFSPSEYGSDVFLRFTKLDKNLKDFNAQVTYVDNGKETIDLTNWYFILPKFLSEKLEYYDVIESTNLKKNTNLNNIKNVSFEDKIKVNSVTYKYESLNSTIVNILCEVTNEINGRFYPYLHGIPYDFSNSSKEARANGSENYQLITEFDTSTWRTGEAYILSFRIPRQTGTYDLFHGFYSVDGDVLNYLTYDHTNQYHLYLGTLNLDDN